MISDGVMEASSSSNFNNSRGGGTWRARHRDIIFTLDLLNIQTSKANTHDVWNREEWHSRMLKFIIIFRFT